MQIHRIGHYNEVRYRGDAVPLLESRDPWSQRAPTFGRDVDDRALPDPSTEPLATKRHRDGQPKRDEGLSDARRSVQHSETSRRQSAIPEPVNWWQAVEIG